VPDPLEFPSVLPDFGRCDQLDQHQGFIESPIGPENLSHRFVVWCKVRFTALRHLQLNALHRFDQRPIRKRVAGEAPVEVRVGLPTVRMKLGTVRLQKLKLPEFSLVTHTTALVRNR